MRHKEKGVIVMAIAAVLFVLNIAANLNALIDEAKISAIYNVGNQMEYFFLPNIKYVKENKTQTFLMSQVMKLTPVIWYDGTNKIETVIEDPITREMILAAQANDENYVDANGAVIIDSTECEEEMVMDHDVTFDLASLQDVEHLLDTYYIIDSTTSVDKSLFDIDTMMNMDMTLEGDGSEPQILIYHSHSQEDFVDSVKGDSSTSIVGVGEYLAEILTEKYGINVIHHTGVYDLIDGVLDRSKAYELAEQPVSKILEENPTISCVIDLHRDGVAESTHLVKKINGKDTAQIMFFNGLSRSKTSGNIEYLYNPYIQDNLAFSIQMQLTAEELYPGFTRKIYLKSYRYNMNLMPAYLLIEAGAQTNTVDEMMNAMEVLADILNEVVQ